MRGLLLFLLVLFGAPWRAAAETAQPKTARPNVVLILADDLGWAELGCYGNRFNETPHLDRLASRGARFTQAYAAAPVCSPFRAALMSGQWPARVGITDYLRPNDSKHLSPSHITLAEMFRAAGYRTAMLGKWHLTGYRNHGAVEVSPTEHGFDQVMLSENRGIGGGSYFHPYHFNREIKQRMESPGSEGREHLIDRMNRDAVEFVERHVETRPDQPFFLYKSHYAVHTRLAGRPDLVAKYSRKPGAGLEPRSARNNVHLAAQLELIDEGLGMLLAKLEALKIADRTIVVFTSDNGGEDRVTSNAPLRAGKSTLYEGGIREPLLIRWPGVTRSGTVCDQPVVTMDFYPTFAEMIGTQCDPSQTLDGLSLAPLLKAADARLDRETLFWHYPLAQPHFLGGRSRGAIRMGDFKLIEDYTTGGLELYDLAQDIGEQHDLAQKFPERCQAMQARLRAWRASLGAESRKHMPPASPSP
jgi:arylsulfatase A